MLVTSYLFKLLLPLLKLLPPRLEDGGLMACNGSYLGTPGPTALKCQLGDGDWGRLLVRPTDASAEGKVVLTLYKHAGAYTRLAAYWVLRCTSLAEFSR